MKDLRLLWDKIITKVEKDKRNIRDSILSSSRILLFDPKTKTVDIKSDKDFVKKLLISKIPEISRLLTLGLEQKIEFIRINGVTVFQDLQRVIETQEELTEEQERAVLHTFEKTFESDIFVINKIANTNKDTIQLNFYNKLLGMSKSLILFSEDLNIKKTRLSGYMMLASVIGIPFGIFFIAKSLVQTKRLKSIEKQVYGLTMLKYEASDKNTKKIINYIAKSDKI